MSLAGSASPQFETVKAYSAKLRTLPIERCRRGEVLRGGIELIEQLAPEWRSLCLARHYNKPFYRPEWFLAFVRAFAAGKQIWLVTLRDQGRLSAILPLVHEQDSILGLPVGRLYGLANDHSPRFDMIHSADISACEAATEIWGVLVNQSGWDVLKAPNVPAGGAFEWILQAAELDGHPTGRWESLRTPFIPLPTTCDPETAQLGETTAKFRANLRRRKRRLSSRGNVSLRMIDKADPVYLEYFYGLEQTGWKGRSGSAINCRSNTRQFYDELARVAESEGFFSLYFLELDGRPVAGHFGFAYEGVYYCPKVGYDERWYKYSPGQLLVDAVLRDCLARGLREFDFVGPEMEWKTDWTSSVRSHSWCFVYSRGWKSRLLHGVKFRIIPTVKQVLGRGLAASEVQARATG